MAPLGKRMRGGILSAVVLGSLSLLNGCGTGTLTQQVTGTAALHGNAHGGIQPITGAQVKLFAAGTGGNGSAARNLLSSPVITDSQGNFSITQDFSCPSPGTQVYLAVTGGNPGLPQPVSNPALVLLAALGNCGDLAGNPGRSVTINEITTTAAVYALAPFATAYDHIGASATNTAGIANAFLNAHLLADTGTGLPPQLPANLHTETAKLIALADAAVPCVNSDGTLGCQPLFAAATPPGGQAPADVVSALLNIIKNPARNIAAVFAAAGSTPPYADTLPAAPHDWTMSLTVTGGGLAEPTQLGLDQFGNVWVANYGGSAAAGLVGFSPQGTPLAGSPYSAGLQTDAYGLAVDKNGDIWVASADNISNGPATGSVAKFHGATSGSPGSLAGQFQDNTLSYPRALAADPNGSGTLLISNYLSGTVTFYNLNGQYVKNLGRGIPSYPFTVSSDNAGGAWVADQGDRNVVHLAANGSVSPINCCNSPQSVALDRHGDVWATNLLEVGVPSRYSISEINSGGSVPLYEIGGGGLYVPGGAALDAAGQFWVANGRGGEFQPYGTLSEVAGNDASVAPGTPLTPIGLGQDAQMLQPYSLAPDASGNLWVSDRESSALTMFFGLATPTATPTPAIPQAP